MAVSAGDAYLDIHGRLAADFSRRLASQAGAPVARAGEQAGHQFGQRLSAGIGRATKVGALALAGGIALGATVAVKKSADFIEKSVQGLIEHNKVVSQTQAVIHSTAGAANLTTKAVSGLSDALERKTTIDGDVIQSGANMLLTFTNIRNEAGRGNDIFNQATKTVLDMSVALGQNTKNSAIQLGKALNDPIKGVTALQRVGVTFTEKQRDQIKVLVESGRTLDAQKIILAELNKEFGGSAAAAATPIGRIQVLFRQLQDGVGGVFLPAMETASTGLLEKFGPALTQISDQQGPKAAKVLDDLAKRMVEGIPPADQIAAATGRVVARIRELARDVGPKVADGFQHLADQVGVVRSQVRPADGEMSRLATTLNLGGAALDVVGQNMDLVVGNLPLLVAGFLAYKGVQAAANVAAAAHVALLPAQIAGNFALARSNRTLAASLGERTAATVITGTATDALTVKTVAAGGAADVAAGKFGRFGGAAMLARLGLVGAAAAVVAVAAAKMKDSLQAASVKNEQFGRTAVVGGKGGQFLAERLGQMDDAQQAAANATRAGVTAADRHTTALRAERAAVTALRSALEGEEHAELDVRQAKINVSSAQARLTELVKGGKKGSLEYKQAQIDLRRAQLDLKAKTDDYKVAQDKASAAAGGAMRASQAAAVHSDKYKAKTGALGTALRKAGENAVDMGKDARRGINMIPANRVANITAKFGWQGLQVFRVGPKGQTRLAAAKGMRITEGTGPTADDVLIRASKYETVVSAADSARPEFIAWAKQRRIPGFAEGGRVGVDLRASFPTGKLKRPIDQFEGTIERVLNHAARALKNTLAATSFLTGGSGAGFGAGSWMRAIAELRREGVPYNIISTYRRGARTAASGSVSFHALNRAVDLTGPDMLRIWAALTDTSPTELIYSRASMYKSRRGWNPISQLDPITYANHIGHVHAAYRRGGRIDDWDGSHVRVNAFHQGAWRVDRDRLGLVQGGEMVLSTPIADAVRSAVAGGGRTVAMLDPADRRALARDLADVLAAQPPQVFLDRERVDRSLQTARQWNQRIR